MSQVTPKQSGAVTLTEGHATSRRVGVWAPIILTALCAAALFLPTRITENQTQALMMVLFLGPMVAALLFLIWWLFFSKASWLEKFAAIGWTIASVESAVLFSDKSLEMAFVMYLPLLMMFAWTLSIIMFRNRQRARLIAVPISLLVCASICMSLRLGGITGEFNPEFSFRWTTKPEDVYLASRTAAKPAAKTDESGAVKPLSLAAGDWPAFRGPNRDGILRGVRIRTDWKQNPPKELWRQKIGPGWSSVIVVGNRAFTQEQRGPDEAVVCLSLDDGKEVWSHVDKVRFEEAVAGPGPRATPTFADGRLFAMGAKGVLNAFDAATGKLLWTHDLLKENDEGLKEELDPGSKKNPLPMWGFSASPLVVGDKVAIYVGAKDRGVAVFNTVDGKEVWTKGIGGHSYTSTHFANIAGKPTLLSTSNKGVQGLDPATGNQLWNNEWLLGDVVPCVQPSVLEGDRVAIGASFGKGTRIFNVVKSGDGAATNDIATHVAFKPYYSDYVTIGDIAFGFDGAIFACFDLLSGKRIWKGGRYGSGQALLLADQNLLLVVTETDGNVVLVPADKAAHKEIGKFKALTGKTWNHPTIAQGKLIVRNGEEIACFDVAEK